jgi:hypothetical protein
MIYPMCSILSSQTKAISAGDVVYNVYNSYWGMGLLSGVLEYGSDDSLCSSSLLSSHPVTLIAVSYSFYLLAGYV